MSTSSAGSTTIKEPGIGSKIFATLQRIGKSLMLPIAVLPAAGILSRIGATDMLGQYGETADGKGDGPLSILGLAGGAIFANLALIFALGVAIGFAKRADGSTALAGVVSYLVFFAVLQYHAFDTNPDPAVFKAPKPDVFGGIVIGITSAVLWQRFHRTKLPQALAFFSGRRLVPMITALAGMLWGILFGFVWPPIGDALDSWANWMYDNGEVGAGIFGVANRLLLPIGLHHIINNVVWFLTPECVAGTGTANGDLTCFFKATEDHQKFGLFMTGFFPIMMFALPAAAFAMLHEARDKVAAGVLPAAALTSFLTGVTEPLEFSFMFVAPLLYGIHALITGISMALTYGLGIRDGFSFSAGLFDYVINWNLATKPFLLIPIGLGFGALYYFLFRIVIRKFDLTTPGREPDDAEVDEAMVAP